MERADLTNQKFRRDKGKGGSDQSEIQKRQRKG